MMVEATMRPDVEQLLAYARRTYGSFARDVVPLCDDPELVRYLYAPLERFLASGGKHLRALLCELSCRMVGGDERLSRSATLALECFHYAALAHDDVEDGSNVRHGAPSVLAAEGAPLAVNMGDACLTAMFRAVLSDAYLSRDAKLDIMQELVEMGALTAEGQALDLGWARDRRFDVGVDGYLRMAALKSACYSWSTPLVLGCIVGGGSVAQANALRSVGANAGAAFQIRDDILDLEGDEARTGKRACSDLAEGKVTLPVVHALEVSADAEELRAIMVSSCKTPREVLRARQIVEDAGSLAFAHAKAHMLVEGACMLLREAFPDSEERDAIAALAEYALVRDR